MSTAAEYRVRADQFHAMAGEETDAACRLEYERLAQCYGRLADLAERNSLTDVVYETPSGRRSETGNAAEPSER